MSLQETDKAAAAVAKAPRVALDDIKKYIAAEHYFTAGDALNALGHPNDIAFGILTICLLKMANGFIVIGKSAPASPENYTLELGRKLAYEDAIRQLWPLMGFALRDRLHGQAQ